MVTPPPLPPEEPQTPPGFSATGGARGPAASPPPLPPVSGVPPLPPPLPGRIIVTKGKGAVPAETATGEAACPNRAAHGGKAADEGPPPPPLAAPAYPDAMPPPPAAGPERRPPGNPLPLTARPAVKKAPAPAMWICLVLAWIFLGSAKPFTIILGAPLDLAAFILAIVCIVRGRVAQGVIGIVGSVVVSGGIYALAFFRMAFGALDS